MPEFYWILFAFWYSCPEEQKEYTEPSIASWFTELQNCPSDRIPAGRFEDTARIAYQSFYIMAPPQCLNLLKIKTLQPKTRSIL